MNSVSKAPALILAIGIAVGLAALGSLLGSSALRFKEYERTVTVKGLSEQEHPADIVLWPIQFTAADNDLGKLYDRLEADSARIREFLIEHEIEGSEITVSPPSITDKLAQQYGGGGAISLRYTALQTITVYSPHVDRVRGSISDLARLGKAGIVFTGGNYDSQTQYIFTRLSEIKPAMVEEATHKARSVAEKFAKDSQSQLGKIKRANQGQFSITSRDGNTPHIKKVRIVSTIEYYLSD